MLDAMYKVSHIPEISVGYEPRDTHIEADFTTKFPDFKSVSYHPRDIPAPVSLAVLVIFCSTSPKITVNISCGFFTSRAVLLPSRLREREYTISDG
jgi:hypothetical protein